MKKLEKMLKKYGKDAKVEMTIEDLYEFANYIIKEVSDNGSEKSNLLSIKEVCKKLNKKESTIYRWQKLGLITPTYIGGHTYYKEEEIMQYTNGYKLVG
ncbi:MAG: helix-turn-helix domain-containing protein [Alistipes sp.]|nr:helix-turn-helix domain-containing protein [Alistipes sp.]